MTDVPEFGTLDDLDDLDLEPIAFVLRGYKIGKGNEKTPVKHTFTATKMRPFSALNEFLEAIAANAGLIGYQAAVPFLLASLSTDEERERMIGLFDGQDFYMDALGLASAADWLSGVYLGRPTKRPSDSPSGPDRAPTRSRPPGGARAGARSTGSRRR